MDLVHWLSSDLEISNFLIRVYHSKTRLLLNHNVCTGNGDITIHELGYGIHLTRTKTKNPTLIYNFNLFKYT